VTVDEPTDENKGLAKEEEVVAPAEEPSDESKDDATKD